MRGGKTACVANYSRTSGEEMKSDFTAASQYAGDVNKNWSSPFLS